MDKIDILNYMLLTELKGYEERKRMCEVEGRIVELRTGREEKHNIPHFHVRYSRKEGSYKIEDCSRIVGNLSSNDEKKIKKWYDRNKELLFMTWKELYPNLPVRVERIGELNDSDNN